MISFSRTLAAWLLLIGAAGSVSANPGDIISIMPLPGGYSGGLAWDGTYFWATNFGSNVVIQFDTSGNITRTFGTPGGRPGGLIWDGSSLWVSDYASRLGGTNNGVIYKMDANGNVLTSLSVPGSFGLAWDGSSFWQTDYYIDRVWRIDTSGNVISSFPSPNAPCFPCFGSAITYDGTNFYYVNNSSATIYKLDRMGNVLASFDGPQGGARGMAWDGNSLWVSTSLGLFQIEGLPSVQEVEIDIKPGSSPNSISLSSSGVVPVAILSTLVFNAPAEVNPETINLAGAKVKLVGKSAKYLCHATDVDSDTLIDLVCQVETVQFLIEPGDSTAVLEAETFSGRPIRGQDSIKIVPQ